MNKKVAASITPGSLDHFGGNPLAMKIGNAVLDKIMKKNFLKTLKKFKYF